MFLWFHFWVSFICDHRTILMFRIILRFERKILHLGDLCAEWICKTESDIFLKGKRVPSVPYRQNGFKEMFCNQKELKMYLLYSFILMLFLLFSRLLTLFINNVLPYLKKKKWGGLRGGKSNLYFEDWNVFVFLYIIATVGSVFSG